MTDKLNDRCAITPALYYDDANAALDWLERAFGFEPRFSITDDDGKVSHAEMAYRDMRIIVGPSGWSEWAKSPKSLGGSNTCDVHLQVADADAHCAQARAAGAKILQEPGDQFYGDRTYRALDPEGHVWSFGQFLRNVPAKEMEDAINMKVNVK
jgi:uncharacterized glyoxalase superfamily protein PhnB